MPFLYFVHIFHFSRETDCLSVLLQPPFLLYFTIKTLLFSVINSTLLSSVSKSLLFISLVFSLRPTSLNPGPPAFTINFCRGLGESNLARLVWGLTSLSLQRHFWTRNLKHRQGEKSWECIWSACHMLGILVNIFRRDFSKMSWCPRNFIFIISKCYA